MRKLNLNIKNESNDVKEEVKTVFNKLSLTQQDNYVNQENERSFNSEIGVIGLENKGIYVSSNHWYKNSNNPFSEEIVNQWFLDKTVYELGLYFDFGYTQVYSPEEEKMVRKSPDHYSIKLYNSSFEVIFNFKANENYFSSLNTDTKTIGGKTTPVYCNYQKVEGEKYPKKVPDYVNQYSTELLRVALLLGEKIFEDLFK